MLLKRRPPGIRTDPVSVRRGLGHVDQRSVAVLRWLLENKVDFVVVGAVARSLRGDTDARGPVAIVPAPYGRNYERLASALVAQGAGLRSERPVPGSEARVEAEPVKLTAGGLARGQRWMLRLRDYDLDIERAGQPSRSAEGRAPGYQELLYEATRVEVADGIAVQVASPEDLEHYAHLRLTGSAPEFRVTRNVPAQPEVRRTESG